MVIKSKVLKVFLSIVIVIFVGGYLQPVMGCAQQSLEEPTQAGGRIIRADLDVQCDR
ncbi:MAG: hypothetical protein AB4426_20875 [Xenococcaceae cyanobacterium]